MINLRPKPAISPSFNKKIPSVLIFLSFVFLLSSCFILLLNYSQLPDEVPIFYSQKTQVLASKKFLFAAPILIFSVLATNLSFAKLFLSNWPFLSQILIITQTLVAFLILVTQLRITLLF